MNKTCIRGDKLFIEIESNSNPIHCVCDVKCLEKISKHKWCYADGYVYASVDGNKLYFHRFIMGVTDRWAYVDHIDGNTLINTYKNLRICTPRQNGLNFKKKNRSQRERFRKNTINLNSIKTFF